jgi:hypothetical protein
MNKYSLFTAMLAAAVSFSTSAEEVTKSLAASFDSEIFVTQGPVTLTHADIDAFMETVPEADRANFLSSPERIGKLIHNLITVDGMVIEAQEQGFLQDQGVQAQLYRVLADEITKIFRSKYVESIELEDYSKRGRELFLSEPTRFQSQPKVDFYHVLIDTRTETSTSKALRTTLAAYDAFKGGELSIQQLVSEFSDDPRKQDNDGLYTDVPLEALEEPVRQVLQDYETPGEGISEPVRTRYGWHLVQLVNRHEPEPLNWDEARSQAINVARNEHIALAIERRLREYHSETPEFAPEAVEKLLDRYDASFDRGVDPSAVESSVRDERQN